jgi:hypothetical protein
VGAAGAAASSAPDPAPMRRLAEPPQLLRGPWHPAPAPGRLASSQCCARTVLVVQGASDPFGMPRPSATRRVVEVPGNHSLKTDLDAVAATVRDWLTPDLVKGRQAAR